MSQHKAMQTNKIKRSKVWPNVLGFACLMAFTALLVTVHQDQTAVLAQTTLKGDPAQGKTKAALCAACHGVAGVSVNPLWPSLAGQQEQYLVKQIKAFRDGEREEITMQPFVANLTDQDVADLSAFYANLSPCP